MKRSILILAALGLGACSEPQDDLQAWMERESRGMRGKVEPLPEIQSFPVVDFVPVAAPDSPFAATRVQPERRASSSVRPDQDRPREPLEEYNLETLRYVGLLRQDQRIEGLVNTGAAIFQVRVGNYMGQDYGLITDISDDSITLKELVEDLDGEWVERITPIQLQVPQGGS